MTSLEKLKLSTITWDSDLKRSDFFKFIKLTSNTVRALEHGALIEAFLDEVLNRVSLHSSAVIPSFLTDHPDLAFVPLGNSSGTSGTSTPSLEEEPE